MAAVMAGALTEAVGQQLDFLQECGHTGLGGAPTAARAQVLAEDLRSHVRRHGW